MRRYLSSNLMKTGHLFTELRGGRGTAQGYRPGTSLTDRTTFKMSLSSAHLVLRGKCVETGDFFGNPIVTAVELGGEQAGYGFGHFACGLGVEKERSGAACQRVFNRASHLVARGPNGFGCDVRQFGMELRGKPGFLGQGGDGCGVRAVDRKV